MQITHCENNYAKIKNYAKITQCPEKRVIVWKYAKITQFTQKSRKHQKNYAVYAP